MKFKSALVTQASGSIGGMTFSHNAGGMYIRARAIPTDPNTSLQQTVRSAVAQLVNVWANVLSAAERAAWNVYASNVPLTDAFGDPKNRSGINHFVRANTPRLQAAATRVDAAPVIFDLGEYTEPSVGFDAAADEIDVVFDNTDAWANEDDSHMIVYCSKPQNPGVNFFKGPYQHAGIIDGDAASPPTSPAAISLPFSVTAGQKVFARIIVSRVDGRLGTPFRDGAVAA